MKGKMKDVFAVGEYKFVFILGAYLLLTELIKNTAQVYILENSFELKLLLFALVVVFLFRVGYYTLFVAIELLVILSIFNVSTGNMIYVLLISSFLKLVHNARKDNK